MSFDVEEKFWKKTSFYIRFLSLIPFIRMVAVCNNLAFGRVNAQSDIDLFVIAKKGRLFTVRILVTALLHILKVRRHGTKISGRFCLSFFVDDSVLDFSGVALPNDIYLAFWIKTMKPVIDDGISSEFVFANSWCKKYFDFNEDFDLDLDRILVVGKIERVIKRLIGIMFSGFYGNFFEFAIRKWQIKRARMKKMLISDASGIIVSEHILKFHNVDRRRYYRDLCIKKYGSCDRLTLKKISECLV